MIIVGTNRKLRTVYAEQAGDEFILSPFPEYKNGRRPVNRFDSREELERSVENRRCEVVWLTN